MTPFTPPPEPVYGQPLWLPLPRGTGRAVAALVAVALAVLLARPSDVQARPAPRGLAQPPETATSTNTLPPPPTDTATVPPPTETPFVPTATHTAPPPATAPPTATETSAPTSTDGPTPTATIVRRSADERPILTLDKIKTEPGRPAPGQAFDLEIEVRNVGKARARNVRVSLQSDSFLAEGRSSGIWKDGIKPDEERDFDTRMRALSTLKAGTYSVLVTLSWEDDEGNPGTQDASFGIEVGDAVATRPLVTILASRVPGRVAPGAPFGVAFTLQNIGGRLARNVLIVPAGPGPLALHGGGEATPIELGPGAQAEMTLRLVAADQASPGAVSQSLELRYDDPDGVRYTESQPIGLTIIDRGAYGPLPLVTAYRGTDGLNPGQVFELSLDVTNAGNQDAQRTVLSFGGGSSLLPDSTSSTTTSLGPFAPLGRGTRVFLDRLAVGETRTIAQRMVVDGAAKPGVYTLDISFSFADGDGTLQVATDIVTLLVSRKAQLEINALDAITDTVVGLSVPFSVELINAGTASVNVSQVDVVGDDALGVEAEPRFIGALDAGAADLVEAQVTPKRATEDGAVLVRVHYLDDFNQPQIVERSFRFRVAEAPTETEPDGESEQPAARRPLLLRILRGLLGLGASQPATTPDDATAPAGALGPDSAPVERGEIEPAPAVEGEVR